VGIEDTLFGPDGKRATSVQQIEKMVAIARELNREVATGEDAHRIYQIGTQWSSTDETLHKLRMAPNRVPAKPAASLRRVA
jgi:hypothetical protein